MHVIIVGCGRVGAELAQMLSSESHNVVVIDKNPAAFKRLRSDFNGITMEGIGFDPDTLKKSGIEQADALVAVTSGDNSNIMIAQVAQKIFKVPKVVSRLYDSARAHIYRRFGLDTICTTTIGANVIKRSILRETSSFEVPFGKDNVFVEYKVQEGE